MIEAILKVIFFLIPSVLIIWKASNITNFVSLLPTSGYGERRGLFVNAIFYRVIGALIFLFTTISLFGVSIPPKIFLSPIGILFGLLMIARPKYFVGFFGENTFLSGKLRWLGFSGMYFLFQLMGIGLMIVSLLWLVGVV